MKLGVFAFRNILRNKNRSILSSLAIIISSLGIVVLFSLLNGMLDNLVSNVKNFTTGDIRIEHRDFEQYEHLSPLHLAIEDAHLLQAQINRLPGVESSVIRVNFPSLRYVPGESAESIPVMGIGVDFAAEQKYMNIDQFLTQGRLPTPGTNEALVGRAFIQHHKLSLGDMVTVLTTTRVRGSNAFSVEIVGVAELPYSQIDKNGLFIPLDRAQHFVRMGSASSNILVKTQTQGAQLATNIQNVLPAQSVARSWRDIGLTFSYVQTAAISYLIIALIFFLLTSTVLINTAMMVIFERIKEIGTLAAMGMNSAALVKLFFLEAFFIALIGSLVGVVGGSILSGILGAVGIDLTSQIQGVDIEFSNIIYPRPTVVISLFVFCYSILVTSIATVIPCMRSARISPVEALAK